MEKKEIKIGNRIISEAFPPMIVAELSCNHNQSLERGLKIIEEAKKAGADAVKLQTYTPEGMTLDLKTTPYQLEDTLWKGMNYFDLYKKAHTPRDWHQVMFQKCKELNLICFSSPFDEEAVDFLESLNNPVYKIASFETTNLPLIKKIAKTHKPVIMSTGATSLEELKEAVDTFLSSGGKELILLKCTSSYPASPKSTHLRTLSHMRETFQVPVGLSDHTLGIGVAIASVALGACLIEKHFTLSRQDGGFDAAFSLEPEELKMLVHETQQAFHALGTVAYGVQEEEKSHLKFRKSLILCQDLSPGDLLTPENLKILRPGIGLAPKFYEEVLGKKVCRQLSKGDPLTWEDLEKNS